MRYETFEKISLSALSLINNEIRRSSKLWNNFNWTKLVQKSGLFATDEQRCRIQIFWTIDIAESAGRVVVIIYRYSFERAKK